MCNLCKANLSRRPCVELGLGLLQEREGCGILWAPMAPVWIQKSDLCKGLGAVLARPIKSILNLLISIKSWNSGTVGQLMEM